MTHWTILQDARHQNKLPAERAVEILLSILARTMSEHEFEDWLEGILHPTELRPGEFFCSSCGLPAFNSPEGIPHHKDLLEGTGRDEELDQNHLPTKPEDNSNAGARSRGNRLMKSVPQAKLPVALPI